MPPIAMRVDLEYPSAADLVRRIEAHRGAGGVPAQLVMSPAIWGKLRDTSGLADEGRAGRRFAGVAVRLDDACRGVAIDA